MNILAVADVFASCGRQMLRNNLHRVISENQIDFVIINGENATHGRGINNEVAQEFFDLGADVITTGNHVWDNKAIMNLLQNDERVLRPANLPKDCVGSGSVVINKFGFKIGVINLIGRTYMNPCDCPFKAADTLIERIAKETNVIIVDFHAEATSEKMAMGWYLDGRVSGIYGTHTHIQTADEAVLPKGTGYITDAGMTGAYYSVLGMGKDAVIERFITGMPQKLEPADGIGIFNAVVFKINENDGKCIGINRINFK